MFLGSRNTLSFCLFVFGFGRPRNSRTWPWTRFELLFKLLTPSQFKIFFTIPRAEKCGTSTTTWVSVISSGSRKSIPFSVQWATDSRPSGSKAVKTQSCHTTFYLLQYCTYNTTFEDWSLAIFTIVLMQCKLRHYHSQPHHADNTTFISFSVVLPSTISQCGRPIRQTAAYSEHLISNSSPAAIFRADWRSVSSHCIFL